MPEALSTPRPAVRNCDQQTLHEAQVPHGRTQVTRTLVLTCALVALCAQGQASHPCALWIQHGRERFLEQSPSLGPQQCLLIFPTVVFLPFTGAIIGVSHSSSRLKRNLWKPHEGEEG